MERGISRTTRDEVREVVARSFLGTVDDAAISDLLSVAIIHHVSAGWSVRRDDGWPGIVVSGLGRAFVWAADGRQVPLRHLRAGDAFGLSTVLGRDDPFTLQAVRDSRILEIDARAIRALVRSDARVAHAVACQLGADLERALRALQLGLRHAVRDRLADILLEMSSDTVNPDGTHEPIFVSHEGLAEAVGTAREVITRHLQVLRRLGIVSLGRGFVTVRCPSRLREAALDPKPMTRLAS